MALGDAEVGLCYNFCYFVQKLEIQQSVTGLAEAQVGGKLSGYKDRKHTCSFTPVISTYLMPIYTIFHFVSLAELLYSLVYKLNVTQRVCVGYICYCC